MFNRSEIFKKAWVYTNNALRYGKKTASRRRELFAHWLKEMWADARRAAAKSAEQLKAERIANVQEALANLVYLPEHMNLNRRAEALEAELRQLQAA